MKLLVIGKGFLGTKVVNSAVSAGYETIATHYAMHDKNTLALDISDINQVENTINKLNPDFVVNCAARGDIDFLESHEDLAMLTNCTSAGNIAKVCKENNIKFVHLSTDSVFDGARGGYTEKDTPNPLNAYARSKYKGEVEVAKNSKDFVIIRTNFYGINQRGNYFFNWILGNLKSHKPMVGFTDVIFSPLDIDTLSSMIIELLDTNYNGIIHLSSGKPISKFDFMVEVGKQLNVSSSNVRPSKQSDVSTIAPRPKNTWLRNDIAKELLKTPILDLTTWLNRNKSEIDSYIK